MPFAGGNQSVADILALGAAIALNGADQAPIAGGTLSVNGVSLGSYDWMVKNSSQVVSSFNEPDWFTSTADSKSAFVVVNGDLTIDAGQVFRPAARKLFTVLYVTGNLVINGDLSMSLRGANHSTSGSNLAAGAILLYTGTVSSVTNPNIPAAGGAGAAAATYLPGTGIVGTAGSNGGTGGGGSGGTASTSAAGAAGTSFSGGPGSGSGWSGAPGAGGANGGAGGIANTASSNRGGGGAGNPGGTGTNNQGNPGAGGDGGNGTGGTLIIVVLGSVTGTGTISSSANTGGGGSDTGGGGAGGGSVTIFYGTDAATYTTSAAGGGGGSGGFPGGAGGAGTVRKLASPFSTPNVGANMFAVF